ncbi:MAG: hypothetical protein U5M23_15415 [Marinagarivorans sp.]|nr:hypothetical protein [Marinagarivorans sp.]
MSSASGRPYLKALRIDPALILQRWPTVTPMRAVFYWMLTAREVPQAALAGPLIGRRSHNISVAPLVLAGGLTPSNISTAYSHSVSASFGVDVSEGVQPTCLGLKIQR